MGPAVEKKKTLLLSMSNRSEVGRAVEKGYLNPNLPKPKKVVKVY